MHKTEPVGSFVLPTGLYLHLLYEKLTGSHPGLGT